MKKLPLSDIEARDSFEAILVMIQDLETQETNIQAMEKEIALLKKSQERLEAKLMTYIQNQ